MDIETYRTKRSHLLEANIRYRELCKQCLQPQTICYCDKIQSFDPQMKFVILLHKLEARRRIATGRMSHLCLKNSELIPGHDFSENGRVNLLLSDDKFQPAVLYPGAGSLCLSAISSRSRRQVFAPDKTPLIFVVDGTWNTARKMIRSRNLFSLPRICFVPSAPSNFRVRKQPAPGCLSTIEAIHQTIELLGDSRGFDTSARLHDGLLSVFDSMVEHQLEFVRKSHSINTHSRHHKVS